MDIYGSCDGASHTQQGLFVALHVIQNTVISK